MTIEKTDSRLFAAIPYDYGGSDFGSVCAGRIPRAEYRAGRRYHRHQHYLKSADVAANQYLYYRSQPAVSAFGLSTARQAFFRERHLRHGDFHGVLEVFAEFQNATSSELLAVVFGGVLLGVGVGLVLRSGGCLDGSEVVAMIVSKRSNFSTGQIIFGINVVIYIVAGFLFGWDRAMYSLLTYFISFKVIDMVEEGLEQAKAAMIITDHSGLLADMIYQRLGRTCTILEGEGLHQRKEGRAVLRADALGNQ